MPTNGTPVLIRDEGAIDSPREIIAANVRAMIWFSGKFCWEMAKRFTPPSTHTTRRSSAYTLGAGRFPSENFRFKYLDTLDYLPGWLAGWQTTRRTGWKFQFAKLAATYNGVYQTDQPTLYHSDYV